MASSSVTIAALASATYPADPQVDLVFMADEIQVVVDTATAVVALSFDGVNDHIRVSADDYNQHQRVTRFGKVWARLAAGAAATLHVQSWTHK